MSIINLLVIDLSINTVVSVIPWDDETPNPYEGSTEYLAVPVVGDAWQDWVYHPEDGTFTPPVLTPEQILAKNEFDQLQLKAAPLNFMMATIYSTYDFGDGTDERTLLAKAWQAYYAELLLVDLTVADPAWPTPPTSP